MVELLREGWEHREKVNRLLCCKLVPNPCHTGESTYLSSTVNASLVGVFTLPMHSCCHHAIQVWSSEQCSSSVEDGSSIVQRRLRPRILGLECSLNGFVHEFRSCVGILCHDELVLKGALLGVLCCTNNLSQIRYWYIIVAKRSKDWISHLCHSR